MDKKIKPLVYSNYDKFLKKLEVSGISKEKAEELSFHFLEIEGFCIGFEQTMIKILEAKNNVKEKIREELDHLYGELSFHIIKNHFIPTKNILHKYLNK